MGSKSSKPWWQLLLNQFANPIVLILIAATFVSMVAGDVTDGLIILGIVIPSGLLGFFQEHRAGQTMARLLQQVQLLVTVIREGTQVQIPSQDLVVGDLVALSAGNLIPADLIAIESLQLLLDESALTGESFPAEKAEQSPLYFGTHVVSGSGIATVTATGSNTKYGYLVQELEGKNPETGFEKGTRAFGRLLLWSMLVLVSMLLVTNVLMHRPVVESLLFSLALAVGITPQLLPVIITVSLASGARKMASEKVLVKRLDAIEDFGSIDVLCTDKTGTLTHGVVELSGAFAPDGSDSARVRQLALANASLQTGFVNPLDQAIIDACEATQVKAQATALAQVPYDFQRRRLSVAAQFAGEKTPLLITKGAFNSVYPLCQPNQAAADLYARLSSEGNRVLALATKPLHAGIASIDASEETELELVGLLAFLDPAKPDAADSLNSLRSLGIDTYLITGDNPLVAAHIAKSVGMPAQRVVSGTEFAKFTAQDTAQALVEARVFAEFDPLQKEALIQALKASGKTVGYFGDGINDSAALKLADVGISVDTAVDVAKSAAAIVLLDKSLAVVAHGVTLGRQTFVNTMKYVRVGASAAFGNVFSMAVADVFLPFLPMLPAQILLLNFLTDFPAVTISGDRVDPEAVSKPTPWRIKEIRNFMIVFGLLSSIFDIGTFLLLTLVFHATAEQFRSGWFVESALTELAVMLTLRTSRRFWQSVPSRGLLLTSLLCAAIIVAIPFTPMGAPFQLIPLNGRLLATLFGLTAIYIVLNETLKKWFSL
jgi:Mg2+-importing ATPase